MVMVLFCNIFFANQWTDPNFRWCRFWVDSQYESILVSLNLNNLLLPNSWTYCWIHHCYHLSVNLVVSFYSNAFLLHLNSGGDGRLKRKLWQRTSRLAWWSMSSDGQVMDWSWMLFWHKPTNNLPVCLIFWFNAG